jgi:hypothetical protein
MSLATDTNSLACRRTGPGASALDVPVFRKFRVPETQTFRAFYAVASRTAIPFSLNAGENGIAGIHPLPGSIHVAEDIEPSLVISQNIVQMVCRG